ncbi:MAG: GNAT family N-acetyltransferase, partial [Planctomycetota bacterium]
MATIEPKTVTLKNGKKVCIRNRTLDDAEAMQTYMEAIFADDRYFMSTTEESKEWLTFEVFKERTESFNGHEHKLIIITEADGQIISMSDVYCGPKNRNRHIGHIGISVHADYRDIGLGTVLMQTMIDWATTNPVIEKLALGVWSKNAPA